MPDSPGSPRNPQPLADQLAAGLVPAMPDLVHAINAAPATWQQLCGQLRGRWALGEESATDDPSVETHVESISSHLSNDVDRMALYRLVRRLERDAQVTQEAAFLVGVAVGRKLR